MNIFKGGYRLKFDDDAICNQQIQAVLPDGMSAIKDWHRRLRFEVDAQKPEFHGHRLLIDRLQKTGSERGMNTNRSSDDPIRQRAVS